MVPTKRDLEVVFRHGLNVLYLPFIDDSAVFGELMAWCVVYTQVFSDFDRLYR